MATGGFILKYDPTCQGNRPAYAFRSETVTNIQSDGGFMIFYINAGFR